MESITPEEAKMEIVRFLRSQARLMNDLSSAMYELGNSEAEIKFYTLARKLEEMANDLDRLNLPEKEKPKVRSIFSSSIIPLIFIGLGIFFTFMK